MTKRTKKERLETLRKQALETVNLYLKPKSLQELSAHMCARGSYRRIDAALEKLE